MVSLLHIYLLKADNKLKYLSIGTLKNMHVCIYIYIYMCVYVCVGVCVLVIRPLHLSYNRNT